MWVMVLQAAQEWGAPPWVVEEQASKLWWERWRCWKEEKGRFEEGRPSTGSGTRQRQAPVMDGMDGMDG